MLSFGGPEDWAASRSTTTYCEHGTQHNINTLEEALLLELRDRRDETIADVPMGTLHVRLPSLARLERPATMEAKRLRPGHTMRGGTQQHLELSTSGMARHVMSSPPQLCNNLR